MGLCFRWGGGGGCEMGERGWLKGGGGGIEGTF
jgi:hypothetical protein